MTEHQDPLADYLNRTEAKIVQGLMMGLHPREIARAAKIKHEKVDKHLRVLEARKVVSAIRKADGTLVWSVSPPGAHRISRNELNSRAHRNAG